MKVKISNIHVCNTNLINYYTAILKHDKSICSEDKFNNISN